MMKTVISTFLFLLLAACSNQQLTSTSPVDDQYVVDKFSEITGASALGTSNQLMDLFNNENSIMYFSEAPSDIGSPQSVVSLMDFQFMGINEDISPYDIELAHIFFFIDSYENKASLLVRIEVGGQAYTKVFDNDPSIPLDFSDDEFVAIMNDSSTGQSALVLRSFQIHESYDQQLAPNIQLRVGTFDNQGTEVDNGKFSSLIGFGIN